MMLSNKHGCLRDLGKNSLSFIFYLAENREVCEGRGARLQKSAATGILQLLQAPQYYFIFL
jgi:hypothetical protein